MVFSSKKIVLGWLGVGAVALISLLAYSITSMWFLISLLPPQNDALIALKTSDKNVQGILSLIKKYEPISEINNYLQETRKVIYQKQGSNQTLILVSKLAFIDTIKQNITTDGWNISQIGPVIMASKGQNNPLPSGKTLLSRSMQGLLRPWQEIFQHQAPFHPLTVVSLTKDTYGWVDQPMEVIAQYSGRQIHTQIALKDNSTQKINWSEQRQPQEKSEEINDKGLFLALPPMMLSSIPKIIGEKLTNNLAAALSLKQDSLNRLLNTFSTAKQVIISLKDGRAVIGVIGQKEEFISYAQDRVKEAEALYYPQKKAFRLPDGTLGYELVPGKPEISWVQTGDGCAYMNGEKTTWWICRQGEVVLVGLEKNMVQQALKRIDQEYWQVAIQREELSNIQLPFQHLLIQGKEKTVNAYIK